MNMNALDEMEQRKNDRARKQPQHYTDLGSFNTGFNYRPLYNTICVVRALLHLKASNEFPKADQLFLF